MRVKVVGDLSQPRTLQVFDAETGEILSGVIAVDIHLSMPPDDCHITLTMWQGEVAIEGEAVS